MSRDLPTEIADAIAAGGSVVGVIALLGEFRFDSGIIGMWTGYGNLEYNGVNYSGGGNLVNVSAYEETLDLQAKGLTLTLSGVSSDMIEIAENEPYQGRVFKLRLALVDINLSPLTSSVIASYPLFSGIMDVMDTQDNAENSIIQLSVENVLTLLSRTKTRRYTDQDQKSRYPDDEGLSFIAQLQDKSLVW